MLKPFFVWKDKVYKRINPEDVTHLYAERNYIRIHFTDDSSTLVRSTLSSALKKLPSGMFIKIHRSYVVSIYFIDNIERDALIVGKESIPIGRQYYRKVIEQLNIIE